MKELLAALLLIAPVCAAEFTARTGSEPPPEQIGESIRAVLGGKPAVLLEDGQAQMKIWFRQEIPLKSKPSSVSGALDAIGETTLLGALAVERPGLKDYKNNPIPKGLFTVRFVVQPQDGDHLGTAEFSSFAALLPSEADQALTGFTRYTPMVKASGKLTSTGHPVIISLRPAGSAEGPFPSVTEPLPDHKALRVKLAGKTAEGEAADLVFDLVFEGHGHIQ